MVPDMIKRIEQVGSAYEKLKVKMHKLREKEEQKKQAHAKGHHYQSESESSSEEEDEELKSEEQSHSEEWEKKRKRKTKEDIEREVLLMGDLYGIMGLEDRTYEAGDNEIKASYRRLVLQFHPDKLGENIKESDKEIWLKIQNAYETLIDPAKRRKYDSSLPFDDSIPDDDDLTEDNFYDILEPVFKRNARFATKKPVPNMGDKDTPIE